MVWPGISLIFSQGGEVKWSDLYTGNDQYMSTRDKFVKFFGLFKKPETFVSKLLGNTGCSPFQQAEFDSLEVN